MIGMRYCLHTQLIRCGKATSFATEMTSNCPNPANVTSVRSI